jgi:predicted metal-binding membrane protein
MSLPPSGTAAIADRGGRHTVVTLGFLAALTWAAVVFLTRSSSLLSAMPGRATLVGAMQFTGMWLLMMAAMMLPSATPIALLFRTIQRRRGAEGNLAVSTAAFLAGYLLVWTLAGLLGDLAYVAGLHLARSLHTGAAAIPAVGGGILVVAGLYQFAPLKSICLARCRSPFHFILHHWREGRLGAVRMGASHGAYCLGCCWGIMAVLFVVGLMNLAWMAALSVLIVVEKLMPWGRTLAHLVGALFIVLGIVMTVRPAFLPAAGLQPSDTMAMARMVPTAPAYSVRHAAVVAGPYAIALTVSRHGRVTVDVADRAMGRAVTGARVSMRVSGMTGPITMLLRPLGRSQGSISGRYAATIGLMPGRYAVTLDVNGRTAALPVHI